jgi:hypothetical protein
MRTQRFVWVSVALGDTPTITRVHESHEVDSMRMRCHDGMRYLHADTRPAQRAGTRPRSKKGRAEAAFWRDTNRRADVFLAAGLVPARRPPKMFAIGSRPPPTCTRAAFWPRARQGVARAMTGCRWKNPARRAPPPSRAGTSHAAIKVRTLCLAAQLRVHRVLCRNHGKSPVPFRFLPRPEKLLHRGLMG